ncbi:hypothetical protein BX600DRAFT_54985 [Xylariales sp. PMI_506]|nr:hypothetical protein BX600DRAFT_54985 [Xylariales sp. PMI_506]
MLLELPQHIKPPCAHTSHLLSGLISNNKNSNNQRRSYHHHHHKFNSKQFRFSAITTTPHNQQAKYPHCCSRALQIQSQSPRLVISGTLHK